MRRIVAALLLLCAGAANAAERLTIDQAVAAALAHNANVASARLEVEKAQTRVEAARTKRLPSLNLDAMGGEALSNLSIEVRDGAGETTRVDLARTFKLFAVVRPTQPITQLHAINLGVKMQETSLAADRERERAARLAVTREVKRAYFAVLATDAYAAALKDAVTAWEEVEREMNLRVSQKAALEADRLDAGARLAATRLAAMSAEHSLATAKDRLAYLVGREIEPVAAEPVEMTEQTENASLRPDVREARLRVEQARLAFRLQAAERIPDIALVVSNTTPVNNDVLPRNMTSAGISMSYEPFTWGRRGRELAEKRLALEQAELALRDTEAAANVEIAMLRRKVAEGAAQIGVRRMETDAARERLRITTVKFQQKTARPEQLLDAEASLTNAAAREQEAIAAWWTARADYEQAIGKE